jgi:hypothetical protein
MINKDIVNLYGQQTHQEREDKMSKPFSPDEQRMKIIQREIGENSGCNRTQQQVGKVFPETVPVERLIADELHGVIENHQEQSTPKNHQGYASRFEPITACFQYASHVLQIISDE